VVQLVEYRRHNCDRRHKTYRTAAGCIWPRAEWIDGRGPFAVLAYCRVLTVTLHQTAESAQRALALINSDACGGLCHNAHGIVQLHRSVAPGEPN
jgi:hypothetical protein